MPRQSRIDAPGALHHVIVRGIARRKILYDDTEFILRRCGRRRANSKRHYRDFVCKGVDQGRRPELTGGGLIRSVGGWTALKALRKGKGYSKGDERILGDSDFVQQVLETADEQFERKFKLRAQGYDFNRVAERVEQ